MSSSLYSKLFLTSYYFTIAIRKKPQKGIIESRRFKAEYVMPATRANWCADPMLIDYESKTYLFYEAVDGNHGRIEVAEINEDCTVGEPTVLLSGECHYSYPFVFSHDGEYYMIPESSAANEVRLYKAHTSWPRNQASSIYWHRHNRRTALPAFYHQHTPRT